MAAISGPTYQLTIEADSEKLARKGVETTDLAALAEESIDVIRRRLEGGSLTVQRVEHDGNGRIVIEVSGANAKAAVATAVGRTAELSIRVVDPTAQFMDIENGIAPPGSEIVPMADPANGPALALKRVGRVSGDAIVNATTGLNAYSGESVVNIQFDAEGGQKFARMTQANVGQRIAIVLDGAIITAPIVQEPILDGNVQISGGFTTESAEELAIMLRSGALPVPFRIVEEREIE